MNSYPLNIAERLTNSARLFPDQRGVIFPSTRDRYGRVAYTHLTFAQIDRETDQLARGLIELGVKPGDRLVLMVKPGLEFIALTFALFKAGAVVVLIDPGMGMTNIFNCLAEVEPAGFIAIPAVHWVRRLMFWKFPHTKFNIVVNGRDPFLSDYAKLLKQGNASHQKLPQTLNTDLAAIIFTSGSTGAPKGVCYEHGMFNAQVDMLRECYDIKLGELDLPGFPLFALFNLAMGVTTVIPDMNPTKPAQVNSAKIKQAIKDQGITQAFGSPAFWNRVARDGETSNWKFPSLNRTLSAGGPVPTHVLKRVRNLLVKEHADIFTPYGATEALPVANIGGKEVLERTAALTAIGKGTCVGRAFPQVKIKIIPIIDEPIADINNITPLPVGEIGEIAVSSPSVTREYFRREAATRRAKINDQLNQTFWHRMGDVGYLDEQGLLWFCGRMAHIVQTPNGRMFSVCCEAIFEQHPHVYRAALVGLGKAGSETPVIIIEPESGYFPDSTASHEKFTRELLELGAQNKLTTSIQKVLYHKSFPVDKRHNVKVHREELKVWAEKLVVPK